MKPKVLNEFIVITLIMRFKPLSHLIKLIIILEKDKIDEETFNFIQSSK